MLEVRFRTLMGWKTTELNKECSEFPLRNQLWFKTILCSIWSASHIEASFPCIAKSFTIEHDRVVGPSHPRCSEPGCLTIWVWTKSGGMLALLPCGKLQREMSCAALCFCGGLSAPAAATAKLLQLCPTLCDPIDGSPSGSPVPGILQARTLEWVAISFSSAWKWKVKVKSLSCVRLFATPWTAAHQAPPSMGFSRQEYWSEVPSPSPLSASRSPLTSLKSWPRSLVVTPSVSFHPCSPFKIILHPNLGGIVVKNPPANAEDVRDMGLILRSEGSTRGGHGNPLQYSCLGNPIDRVAWQATVHGVAKSQTWLKWPSTHPLPREVHNSAVTAAWTLATGFPEFRSQLYYFPVVWLQGSFFCSLSLNFFTCNITVMISTSLSCREGSIR